MNLSDSFEPVPIVRPSPEHARRAILRQMAEALEDEAAGLSFRASSFAEEEFLLNRDIEDHQTEISRLQLRLEAVRAEREKLLAKIEMLRREAFEIRQDVASSEDETALASFECG